MHLTNGIKKYSESYHQNNQSFFSELSKGQNPHTLYVSCSDSRVVPSIITQTKPGELFTLENAGQIISKFKDNDLSNKATIEYAIKYLNIKNIVVCGHSDCGAVKALCGLIDDGPKNKKDSVIEDYLNCSYPHKSHINTTQPLEEIVKLHVKSQCENLLSYPYIKSGVEVGDIQIYGLYYDIKTGQVDEVINPKAMKALSLEKKEAQHPLSFLQGIISTSSMIWLGLEVMIELTRQFMANICDNASTNYWPVLR